MGIARAHESIHTAIRLLISVWHKRASTLCQTSDRSSMDSHFPGSLHPEFPIQSRSQLSQSSPVEAMDFIVQVI